MAEAEADVKMQGVKYSKQQVAKQRRNRRPIRVANEKHVQMDDDKDPALLSAYDAEAYVYPCGHLAAH